MKKLEMLVSKLSYNFRQTIIIFGFIITFFVSMGIALRYNFFLGYSMMVMGYILTLLFAIIDMKINGKEFRKKIENQLEQDKKNKEEYFTMTGFNTVAEYNAYLKGKSECK